jgi:hypothetical protein
MCCCRYRAPSITNNYIYDILHSTAHNITVSLLKNILASSTLKLSIWNPQNQLSKEVSCNRAFLRADFVYICYVSTLWTMAWHVRTHMLNVYMCAFISCICSSLHLSFRPPVNRSYMQVYRWLICLCKY